MGVNPNEAIVFGDAIQGIFPSREDGGEIRLSPTSMFKLEVGAVAS